MQYDFNFETVLPSGKELSALIVFTRDGMYDTIDMVEGQVYDHKGNLLKETFHLSCLNKEEATAVESAVEYYY
mgnify:CR=1 FL=1